MVFSYQELQIDFSTFLILYHELPYSLSNASLKYGYEQKTDTEIVTSFSSYF